MDKIKQFLTNLFREDNGSDICIAKVMALIAFLAFIGYAAFGLYKDHFSLGEFASGLMQVLGGSGIAIAGKNFTTKQ